VLVTAEFDLSRDEAEAYFEALRAACVDAKVIRRDDTVRWSPVVQIFIQQNTRQSVGTSDRPE
jgi:acetyl esterase/lipase